MNVSVMPSLQDLYSLNLSLEVPVDIMWIGLWAGLPLRRGLFTVGTQCDTSNGKVNCVQGLLL